MLDILAIIGPLFIAIGAGFAAVRLGVFSKSDIRVLGRFVILIALPALLFKALSERAIGEIINVQYLGAYALGSLIPFLIFFATPYFFRGATRPRAAMIALGVSISNSGFIGFPVIIQFLGTQATVALALSMLVENLLMLPLALALAESDGQQGRSGWQALLGVLAGLVRNPLLLAILAGFLCSLLQLHLPGAVGRVVDMFAAASGPVALFVIGGTLVGLRPAGDITRIASICAGKLILHPLAVALGFVLFAPVDPILRAAGIVIASVPMFSIYPIIAQKYGEQAWCASAVLVVTIVSFFSMSMVMWLLGGVPGA